MKQLNEGRIFLLILLLAFFSVLEIRKMEVWGRYQTLQNKTVTEAQYRQDFYSDAMWEEKDSLSKECISLLENVEKEVNYYPIPDSTVDKSLTTSFTDSWMAEREYNGTSGHEGTDIMASKNQRGVYPVISMTDGEVTNLGWLEKGGYRVGITSVSGTYYYYAHLECYSNLKEGDYVKAGELLGYMGDSGYGPEGTRGKFAVHLHVGIYTQKNGQEISVNPYYVLKSLENKKLKYAYS